MQGSSLLSEEKCALLTQKKTDLVENLKISPLFLAILVKNKVLQSTEVRMAQSFICINS